ncbi:MAG: ATP-binding cassette domain-containing protein [Fibrobacteria bacterium]|nr:ATP-binding cassette domain-containing protein [Fibrobacteria bacterium]
MKPSIEVRGLSKSYRIRQSENGRYGTDLSDDLAHFARSLMRGKWPESRLVEFKALDDVSFDIMPGETVGLVGKNGAGKSTLLKVLARVVRPTAGQALLRGKVGSLLEVGTGFHPDLTGRDNVYLAGAILGMPREEIRRKFDEIVEFAEVPSFLDTPVKRYSSGMYTRLAFSVAAHLETDILLVDEVLAVGDAAFQRKCLGKMDDVARHGRTVVFVSHSASAVQRLCRSALLLSRGRLADQDTSERILAKYAEELEGSGSRTSWTAPTDLPLDPAFEPLSATLRDRSGQEPTESVLASSGIGVEFAFRVKTVEPGLLIGFSLFSEDGTQILRSFHSDPHAGMPPPLPVGEHTLTCPIPGGLLNEGRYRIEVVVWVGNREFFTGGTNPALSFTVEGGLSESAFWRDRRAGILAPTLPWVRTSA